MDSGWKCCNIRFDALRLVSHEQVIGGLGSGRKRADVVRRQWSIRIDGVADQILLVLGKILRDNIGDGLEGYNVGHPLLLFSINIQCTPTKGTQQTACIEVASKEGKISNLRTNARIGCRETGQGYTAAKR